MKARDGWQGGSGSGRVGRGGGWPRTWGPAHLRSGSTRRGQALAPHTAPSASPTALDGGASPTPAPQWLPKAQHSCGGSSSAPEAAPGQALSQSLGWGTSPPGPSGAPQKARHWPLSPRDLPWTGRRFLSPKIRPHRGPTHPSISPGTPTRPRFPARHPGLPQTAPALLLLLLAASQRNSPHASTSPAPDPGPSCIPPEGCAWPWDGGAAQPPPAHSRPSSQATGQCGAASTPLQHVQPWRAGSVRRSTRSVASARPGRRRCSNQTREAVSKTPESK